MTARADANLRRPLQSPRILVLGASGSGKSTLAARLGELKQTPVFDLDAFHGDGAGYARRREPSEARALVSGGALQERWIIEGVFGWLAELAVPRVKTLIWLDLPGEACREGLLERGKRGGATQAEFDELLARAEQYWRRPTSSSYYGHARIFADFPGVKFRLCSRDEIMFFLERARLRGGAKR